MKKSCVGLVAVLGTFALVGCSQEANDAQTSGDNEVVGVTDLKELEQGLGLTVDTRTNGAWSRGDDKLTKGSCYQELKGPNAKEPQNYEFRRYSKGAAFFRKANTGAASGDKRPVTCVDVDIERGQGPGGTETISVDGFMLDAALRYKLGRPTGYDAGMSHLYFAFNEGAVQIQPPDTRCGLYADPSNAAAMAKSADPGLRAFGTTYAQCKGAGGADAACGDKAMKACVTAGTLDCKAESLDRPSIGSAYIVEMTWRDLAPEQAMLAYKYAWKKAKDADLYSLSDDPVGRYLTSESYGDGPGMWHVARFEHLDVHHTTVNTGEPGQLGVEELFITPKSSDRKIQESAIVSCSRPLASDGAPTKPYSCKGL